jgi:hypothetical protein
MRTSPTATGATWTASGPHHDLGWAAPLLVDSFTLAASLEVLRSGLAGQRAIYPWTLVFGATAASAALNVAHAPDHLAAELVAGIPPVALLLALELLMRGARTTYASTGWTAARSQTRPGSGSASGSRSTRPLICPPGRRPSCSGCPGPVLACCSRQSERTATATARRRR